MLYVPLPAAPTVSVPAAAVATVCPFASTCPLYALPIVTSPPVCVYVPIAGPPKTGLLPSSAGLSRPRVRFPPTVCSPPL